MPKKKSSSAGLLESAHNIWLAGLGGLAVAEEEGGKLFRSLVEKGKEFEARLPRPVGSAGESLRGTVKQVRSRAGKTFEGFEASIDDGLASTLGRLGIPTRDEITKLTRRVERLTKAVDGRAKPKRKAAKKKPARSKAASRRGTRRAAAAKGR